MNRRSRFLRLAILVVVVAIGFPCAVHAAEASIANASGLPVLWSDWVEENAPVVVLLWASWVPDADQTLAAIGELTAAAKDRDLELVLIVVQEPLEEARDSLENIDVDWYHDRYGRLLKDYRVVSIPRLLVLAEDGRAIERLDANPQALGVRGGG